MINNSKLKSNKLHRILILDSIQFNIRLIKYFIILSFFSGPIIIISIFLNLEIIKLWKELFVILLCFSATVLFTRINLYKLLIFNLIIIFVILHMFFATNLYNTIYQFKLDIIPLIYAVTLYFFSKKLSYVQLEELVSFLIRTIVILGFLNSLSSFLESLFFTHFLKLLGIEYGSWGNHGGLKIITAFGLLRAPGLTAGFVQSGTLSLLAFILYMNLKNIFFKHSFFISMLISIIFILGILSTTYKTGILGMIFAFFSYIILRIKMNKNIKYFIIFGSSFLIFIVFSVFAFSYYLYNVVANFNEYLAYNSIYMRVYFHHEVFSQIKSIYDLLFGVGYGVNGTYDLKNNMNAIPLDSTFIYIFSNFGLLGLVFFIGVIIFLIIYFAKKGLLGQSLMLYFIYIITFEFYFNNIIANFPLIFILITLTIFSYSLFKKRGVLMC